MQQLSHQDAVFAYMETASTPAQLAWLNIYDPSTAPGGQADFDAILRHVEARLHTAPFYRQKLVFVPGNLAEPYWVDDEAFNLEYHVRHIALPPPGDWAQLCTLAARVFARPFDLSKPLWELYVIDGLDRVEGYPPGCFAVLAKMHHAAIDGVSGVDVTTWLHSPRPDTPLPPRQAWHAEPRPSRLELVLRAMVSRAMNPGRRSRTIARSLPGIGRLLAAIEAGDLRKPRRRKIPPTRFSGPVGRYRVMAARRFRLEDVKPIRRLAPGSTVNDVVLAVVGGALRRYLLAHRELPPESLVSACPISVRTEAQSGQLGNQISFMFIGLATDCDDPAERLRSIRADTDNAKGFNERIGARTLTELSEIVPGALVGLGMRLSTRLLGGGVANTTVTNVPGPRQPLYLAGARALSQFALGPLLPSLGLFHTVLSYCGEVTLTVVADRDKLPDPDVYSRCIAESFAELAAAAAAV
ncbi:MAG: wax ester/triacylglycerol synthase family O-acyltransferase [Rhizorhabdus sp.]